MIKRLSFFIVLLLIPAISTCFAGEGAWGYVAGFVSDQPSSSPIPAAMIRSSGVSAYSAADGSYRIRLAPGLCKVSFSNDFYHPVAIPDILVIADQTTTVSVAMKPSGQWRMFGGGAKRTRRVPIQSNLGVPGVAWKYPLKPKNPAALKIADLDNDGIAEIIALHGERLYVFRGDGSLLWESRGGAGNEIGTLIGIYDLDNNGVKDILTGNQSAEDSFGILRMARLTILNALDGSVRYSYSFFDAGNGHCGATGNGTAVSINAQNTRVFDLDGDSCLEILTIPDFSHKITLFDFSQGVENGRVVYSRDFPKNGASGLAIGDIDGDDQLEAVTDWLGDMRIYDAATGLLKYSFLNFHVGDSSGATVITDVDGDGVNEIIKISPAAQSVTVFDVNDEGVQIRWQKNNMGEIYFTHGAVADMDGDLAPEILLSVRSDKMYVLSAHNGDVKWSVPDRFPKGLVDVDADGRLEIMAGTSPARSSLVIYDMENNAYSEKAALPDRNWVHGPAPEDKDPGANYAFFNSTPNVQYLGNRVLAKRNGTLYAYAATSDSLALDWKYVYSPANPERNLMIAIGDVDGDSLDETILFVDDGSLIILDDKGLPQSIVSTYFGGLYVPLVADLNHDGKNDIIVMDSPGAYSRPLYYMGDMKILDASNAALDAPPVEVDWGYKGLFLDMPIRRYWTPVIQDLDGDGLQEMIIMADPNVISVLNFDGSLKWNFVHPARYLGTGHFNDDDILDVFAASINHDFVVLNGENGDLIWGGNKSSLWIPSILDIDEDGVHDIAALGEGNYVYAYNGANGNLLWSDNSNCALCNNGTVAIGDLDGDGELELISSGNFGLAAYKRDGRLIWEQKIINAEGFKHHFSALTDVNGDGALDVIQPGNHGIYAFDGKTGEELWRFHPDPLIAVSSVVAGDIDGDGNDEIIFSANDGYLRSLNSEDGSLSWRLFLGYQMSCPILADTDNDGECEILVSANGRLYCIDKDQPNVSGLYKGCQNVICFDGSIAYSDYPTSPGAWVDLMIRTTANTLYAVIETWEQTPSFYGKWTESTATRDALTSHTLGGLEPGQYYEIRVDETRASIYQADSSGRIEFTEKGGAKKKIFEARHTEFSLTAWVVY